MTELIDAPQATKAINHWIGGQHRAGASGRSGPVFDPATGIQTGTVDFASPEEIDARRPGRKGRVPGLARALGRAPRRALLPHPRALQRPPRGPRAPAHRRARQGALGRDGRGRPRARGDRVLLRDPDAPQGRLHRAGLDGRGRLLDPPAARRRRRDHAVQLPGDGPDVDVGAGARLREHLRPQAVREGSLGVASHRRAARRGRRARRASSTSCTATRPPSTPCSRTRESPRSRSSARRRSPATSTRRRRPPASAARRSVGRRTT